ncbi:hypothetical protein [Bacillus sp. ISL-55]|uniref:hypothetical protein n=1 Tax=Bacillus sp. ISL-55 TaxID=2819134 RepID=UPI001BE73826|nr:hypothetical protein [Bacillus sp. ISL-55]MBT2691935.1 hypothetical protein [Bacillus sp. ISL-55]
MRVITALLIVFSLTLTGCTNQEKESGEKIVPASNPSEKMTPIEYLEGYHQSINTTNLNDFSDLALLEEDLQTHKVFFTGEFHSVADNFPTQTKLLFYLNQNAGVNYYLAELPFAFAEYINLYLQFGDEKILEYLAAESKNTHSEAAGHYQMYRDIYKYNQEQPEGRRIQYLGIDGDTLPNLALNYLGHLASMKVIPTEISSHFSSLKDNIHPDLPRNDQSTPELKAFIKSWKLEVNTNEELYKKAFGKDFDKFLFTLISIENGLKEIDANKKNYGDFNVFREGVLKEAFSYWIGKLPSEAKFFGEWGRAHILLSMEESMLLNGTYTTLVPTIAQYINEEVPQTKGRVLSIPYMYDQSFLNPFRESEEDSVGFTEEYNHLNLLTEYGKDGVTLFKLNGEQSPFDAPNIFIPNPTVNGTLNYFQYVILIKNSEASKSYFDAK